MRTNTAAVAAKAKKSTIPGRAPRADHPAVTRFNGPLASTIIRQKRAGMSQPVVIRVSSDDVALWSRCSKASDFGMFDWLQHSVREALVMPSDQQAAAVPLPFSDGSTMCFILGNDEFDAACVMAVKTGVSLRQWLYSTFKAAAKGGPAA